MNDLDEILDFEEAVDFNLSDNPEVLDVEILDEDGLFNLGDEIGLENSKQPDEGPISLEDTKYGDNSKTQNSGQLIELDNNSSGTTQPQIEHSEDVTEFNLDDPDFLKDYEDTNGGIDNEVNIDEEFWKGLDVDPTDTSGKEGNKESDLSEKLGTNNSISTSPSKENTLKSSSDIDVTNDGKKSNVSNSGKSVTRKSKSPEKEDGEIINQASSTDNNRQAQQQKQTQSQQQSPAQKQTQQQRASQHTQQQSNHHPQQNTQNYRGRGGRRNNDWNQGNVGEFFNGGMSTFRSGYGPGLDGMSGLRPHALPFVNPMTQYHMGAGGHPMNMMPFQGQMEIPPYPMGGRGNNAFIPRGGNPVFGHHNNPMSSRKPANQQSNAQRTTQAIPPKRKAPNDGFDQKEQDNKKTATTNGKSQASENKSTSSPQKNVDRAKTSLTTTTAKNSSNSIPEKPSKLGISSPTTNKAPATKLKRRTDTLPSESTSTSKSTQDSKSTIKSVPKNTPNSLSEVVPSKSPTTNASGPMTNSSNKLTIDNIDDRVNKRELQTMAGSVPGGFTLVTVDRVARSAEITFKTVEGAKMFRRKYNRSVLGKSNIIINFS
ncbi:2436_t:CDS:2 [Dentiscutata heterogama]|uniref:2436_t:CDS:1 n=1 Tax=Dentiscutata heterogama TaxID=1316150 RepID=A0ACA9JWP2_9GLOM|nr:2436_t:CDS:2 [Dentiscutata heterogama]